MNTTINLVLDTRRAKKDGTYPIVIRITHNRKPLTISTGYNVLEKDWNKQTCEIKKSYKDVSNITRLNKYLQKQRIDALDIINELQDSGEINALSVKEIKERIVNKNSNATFFRFTQELIEELKQAGRFGYASSVKATMQSVQKFRDNKDFTFKELNYKFIKQFESHCMGRDLAVNSIAVFMKTIKMIFNRAIKAGIIKKELYPFTGYTIKTTKTKKRAVRRDVISLIEKIKLEKGSRVWHARNYFLFSFYTQGMNFVDMAKLKPGNIIADRIEYTRQKTKKDYSIKLTPQITRILKIYLQEKSPEDYIFPIITRIGNPELEYKDIAEKRKIYNKNLKIIADKCGIDTNLTGYVSRHSFATIAKHKGVPISVISEFMGHSDARTTEIYLDSFDKEVLDDYNLLITE